MTAYQVGDWVRFTRNGRLEIGVVNYIRPNEHYPWGFELVTDNGTLLDREVIEVRRVVLVTAVEDAPSDPARIREDKQ